MDNVVIKFTAESDLNKVKADLQALEDHERDIQRAMRDLQSDYQKQNVAIQSNVKGRKEQIAALDKLREKTTQQQKALEDALKTTKKGVGDLDTALKTMDTTVTKGAMGNTFRTQLLHTSNAMKELMVQGKENTQEYKALEMQMRKLAEAQDNFSDRVREMKSDARSMDAVVEGTQLIAGGYSVAQGAMALFGGESKQLEQTMVKLQSAIALTTGLQSIQNALRRESALMLGLESARTKLAAAGQMIYATAIGTSTGAMKLFRLALLATGIGALIVGIGLLIEHWDDLTAAINGNAQSLKEVNKQLAIQKGLNEDNENFDKFALDAMKERGATEVEITRKEITNNINRQKENNKLILTLGRIKDKSEEQSKSYDDALNKQIELTDEAIILGIRLDKQKADSIKKDKEDAAKLSKDATDKRYAANIKALQDKKTLIENELLTVEKGSVKELELNKQLAKASYDIDMYAKNLSDADKLILHTKYIKQITDLDKDAQDKGVKSALSTDISYLKAKISISEEFSDEQINAKKDLVDAEAEIEKNTVRDTITNETELNAKIAEIDAKTVVDKKAIDQTVLDNKKKTNDAEVEDKKKTDAELLTEEQKKEQERQAIIAKGVEVLGMISAAYFDQQNARLDDEMHKLDTFYTSDIEEARNNASLKLISETELNKKRLQIKREQAQNDKKQAIFDATIQGAVATVAAMKTSVLLAVVTAAAVAIQVGLISSKPLPTYWKGKRAKGDGEYAMIGEHGPELMYVPRGAGILPAHNSRTIADAINAMPQYGIPQPIIQNGVPGYSIDYDKLGKAVADNVKYPELKQLKVIVNKDGIITEQAGEMIRRLNQQYN